MVLSRLEQPFGNSVDSFNEMLIDPNVIELFWEGWDLNNSVWNGNILSILIITSDMDFQFFPSLIVNGEIEFRR